MPGTATGLLERFAKARSTERAFFCQKIDAADFRF